MPELEKRVDRTLRSWTMKLTNRSNTALLVVAILGGLAIAAGIIFLAGVLI